MDLRKNGQTSNIIRLALKNSSTGAPLTGLTSASAGLIISTIANNEATPTVYAQASSNIETITTLGTFAAPTASKCRFKEVDATNNPGLYEIQIDDARFAVFSAKKQVVSVSGAASLLATDYEVLLAAVDWFDAVRFGLTALPNAAAEAAGGLFTRGTGAGQIEQDANGRVSVSLKAILGTTLTETAGQIAAAFKKFFDKASPTGTINSLPDAVPGAANALLINGTNTGTGVTLAALTLNSDFSISGNLYMSGSLLAATSIETGSFVVNGINLSGTRIGYLDNLNVGGLVASSAEATAIQNNTRVVRVVPSVIERPDSGTLDYRIELLLYDDIGNMEAPDSAPTVALVNQAGTDLSARLDSTTMSLVSTGRYRAIYTADDADDLDQLVWAFSVVEGGNTRIYGNTSLIVDTTAVDFTAADRAKLDTLHDTRIPGVIQPQTGDSFARIGALGVGLTALASQASVDDIPTNAELATALAAADDAVLAAIAALNNLSQANIRAAVGLANADLDTQLAALPTADENADAYLDRSDAIEVGLTPRQAHRLEVAAAAGKLSGAATTTVAIRNAVADSKDRIVATVDADGNRSAITTDVS